MIARPDIRSGGIRRHPRRCPPFCAPRDTFGHSRSTRAVGAGCLSTCTYTSETLAALLDDSTLGSPDLGSLRFDLRGCTLHPLRPFDVTHGTSRPTESIYRSLRVGDAVGARCSLRIPTSPTHMLTLDDSRMSCVGVPWEPSARAGVMRDALLGAGCGLDQSILGHHYVFQHPIPCWTSPTACTRAGIGLGAWSRTAVLAAL